MKILVLGSGVVGVTSAWYLRQAGHEVAVIERQSAPAQETSQSNGGQISVSHSEPWASPDTPLQVLRWLRHEDSPLLWRMRADAAQWRWGMQFLLECLPHRHRRNIAALVHLGLHSRACVQALRRELSLQYDCLERGILHLYTDEKEYARALPKAALMRQFGCEREAVSVSRCQEIEPALTQTKLVGGIYSPSDESGDARLFTEALAKVAEQRGVQFRFNATIHALIAEQVGVRRRVTGVELEGGERLLADAVVVALGSYTPPLLQPLGVHVPIYPGKGYSITLALPQAEFAGAPFVSLIDDECKIVTSRFGARLRVAGTAEFNGYNTDLLPVRVLALRRRICQLFPAVTPYAQPEALNPWAGLRPATPSMVPLIGPVPRYENCFINSGHGTLGWTMSCGSAQILADLVSGRVPQINAAAYAPLARLH